MKKLFSLFLPVFFFLCAQSSVHAHFAMLIPSDSMVMQGDDINITVTLSFSHPFEGVGMEMAKPMAFGVIVNDRKYDLLNNLGKTRVMGHTAWQNAYRVGRPGIYTFFVEPAPYWEPAEDCYIIHYTKSVVMAFGIDEGWDREIGLKTEIVPLAKPFGLYAGNVFQGIVKLDKKPVPYAEVEVEFYNIDGTSKAPNDYMVTQTIRADQNGVFTYAVPKAGWWGFAALSTADYKLAHEGEDKEVELGAVLWVRFHDWQER